MCSVYSCKQFTFWVDISFNFEVKLMTFNVLCNLYCWSKFTECFSNTRHCAFLALMYMPPVQFCVTGCPLSSLLRWQWQCTTFSVVTSGDFKEAGSFNFLLKKTYLSPEKCLEYKSMFNNSLKSNYKKRKAGTRIISILKMW